MLPARLTQWEAPRAIHLPDPCRQLCPSPSHPCRRWAWSGACPWILLCPVSGTAPLLALQRDAAWSCPTSLPPEKYCRKPCAKVSFPPERSGHRPRTRWLWAAGNVDMEGGLLIGNGMAPSQCQLQTLFWFFSKLQQIQLVLGAALYLPFGRFLGQLY